eukprot:Tbor_TRINITY_DN8466_c0_g1::TRINITY_DN8466_c0_g1_i1::g.5294::m.5294
MYNDPRYQADYNHDHYISNSERRHLSEDRMPPLPVSPSDNGQWTAARSLLTSLTSLEFGGNAHPFPKGITKDMRSKERTGKTSYSSSISNLSAQSLSTIVATAIPSSFNLQNNKHHHQSPSYYHNAVVRMTVEGLLIYRPKDHTTFLGVEAAASTRQSNQRYSSNSRGARNGSTTRSGSATRHRNGPSSDDLPSSAVPFLGTIPWEMIADVMEEPLATPIVGLDSYAASSAAGHQYCIPQYSPTRLILTFATSTPSGWGPHHSALLFLMSGVVLDVQTATLSEALIEGIKLMSADDFAGRVDVFKKMQFCSE